MVIHHDGATLAGNSGSLEGCGTWTDPDGEHNHVGGKPPSVAEHHDVTLLRAAFLRTLDRGGSHAVEHGDTQPVEFGTDKESHFPF